MGIGIFLVPMALNLACLNKSHAAVQCSPKNIYEAKSLKKAKELVIKCPRNAEIQHALGIRLARMGRHVEALKWLDKAIMLAPDNARFKMDRIVVLSWMGKNHEAIEGFKNLPPTVKRPVYVLRNVARAAYNINDFNLSEKMYQEVLKINPRDGEALKGAVFSLARAKQFEKAEILIREAAKKDFSPTINLGFLEYYVLLESGDFKKAYKIWKNVQKEKGNAREWFSFWQNTIRPISGETRKKIGNYFYTSQTIPIKDRFLITALIGDYAKALKLISNSSDEEFWAWPPDYLNWLGWCYFKTKNYAKGIDFYQKILQRYPDNRYAMACLSFCFSAEREFDKAKKLIDTLLNQNPNDIEALFALAYMKEQQGLFLEAVLVYEKILKFKPDNKNAQKLRLRALSDLGIPSLSIKEAEKLKLDSGFLTSLKLDEAAYFLRWGLKKEPLALDEPIAKNHPENLRARYDYILALRQSKDYKKVIEAYEGLLKEDHKTPYWVEEATADSYLYLEEPKKAEDLYRKVLKVKPHAYNANMGLFYALQEQHKWDEAWALLRKIDKETPPGRRIGKVFLPSWKKMEVLTEKSWLLMEEDRYQEAQEYLDQLLDIMPAYMGIRTAQGHLFLWRGWPRRALEEFSIATTRNPNELRAWIGKAYTLFELGDEKEANATRDKLLKEHPKNKYVQTLDKYLRAREAPRLLLDYDYDHEDNDSTDITFREEFSVEPILTWRFYQYFLWRRSTEKSLTNFYRRIGAGWYHRFNSTWSWQEAFSADTNGHSDFGILSALTYSPNDFWKIKGLYDTSTPNIPMKARPYGITGDEASLRFEYNESEWRRYYLDLNAMFFSDQNDRYAGFIGYDQGLFVKKGWLSRVNIELGTSHNTKRDAPYFNPRNDWTATVTPMIQKTHYQRYGKQFVHRLFATAGAYYQEDYGTKFIGSVRYEQDIKFSLNSALLWGILYGQRAYDGDTVRAVNFYVRFEFYFGGF